MPRYLRIGLLVELCALVGGFAAYTFLGQNIWLFVLGYVIVGAAVAVPCYRSLRGYRG